MTILVTTDEWLIELRTRLPGISEGQLGLELKSTLREFFTKSGFWMEELSPIPLLPNKTMYKLTYPQARVMGVHAVAINGTPVGLVATKPHSTTKAAYAYMSEADLMELFPVRTSPTTDTMIVIARLNPLPGMCKVPVETVTHFFDEVMDGVLGRLYSMPGKPYTNLVQAQYHLKRFRDGIAMARDMGRKRYSTATRGWMFPQNWSGTNFKRGNSRTA